VSVDLVLRKMVWEKNTVPIHRYTARHLYLSQVLIQYNNVIFTSLTRSLKRRVRRRFTCSTKQEQNPPSQSLGSGGSDDDGSGENWRCMALIVNQRMPRWRGWHCGSWRSNPTSKQSNKGATAADPGQERCGRPIVPISKDGPGRCGGSSGLSLQVCNARS